MAKLCKSFYASWWFIILVRRWWFAEPVTSLIMCQESHILITTVVMHLSCWYIMCIAHTSPLNSFRRASWNNSGSILLWADDNDGNGEDMTHLSSFWCTNVVEKAPRQEVKRLCKCMVHLVMRMMFNLFLHFFILVKISLFEGFNQKWRFLFRDDFPAVFF